MPAGMSLPDDGRSSCGSPGGELLRPPAPALAAPTPGNATRQFSIAVSMLYGSGSANMAWCERMTAMMVRTASTDTGGLPPLLAALSRRNSTHAWRQQKHTITSQQHC